MLDFGDVRSWIDALEASPLFPVALPILVATAFAAFADWFDRYLAANGQAPSQWHADVSGDSARRRSSNAVPVSQPPLLEAGRAHNADRY